MDINFLIIVSLLFIAHGKYGNQTCQIRYHRIPLLELFAILTKFTRNKCNNENILRDYETHCSGLGGKGREVTMYDRWFQLH